MRPPPSPPTAVLDLLASLFGTRDRVVYLCDRAGLATLDIPDIPQPRQLWTSIWRQAEQGSSLRWAPLVRAAAAELPHNTLLADYAAQLDLPVAHSPAAVRQIDVGVITMKQEEHRALLAKLRPTEVTRGARRDYDVATIDTNPIATRVAVTRCVLQGTLEAQSAVTELAADLSPSFVLVVGIAGAIPTIDFGLGDVIVSSFIHVLNLEDTGAGPAHRRFDAVGYPLHPSATRVVERLDVIERSSTWNDLAAIGVDRPGLDGEFTTGDESWNADVTQALAVLTRRRAPIARAGKLASSDRLIKDPEIIKGWRNVAKGIAAVEMESAGVYLFCQRNHLPVLAVRGISDIIGWKRDEAWTLYACHTAAAYTSMLIQAGGFQRSPGSQ